MVSKSIIVLLVVATFAVVNSHKILAKSPPVHHKPLSSADVEAMLDPVVHADQSAKKLFYTDNAGKEQCLTCQPFQGCGCADIVGIRCELKRLRQKLMRMRSMADPNAAPHHD